MTRLRGAGAGVGDLDPYGAHGVAAPRRRADSAAACRSTAGQPVCTTALVTSSEMSRISVSASGSSASIPDPASRERAHLRARPTSAGSGRDLQLHLKHLHRSHHPNRRTHRLAPPRESRNVIPYEEQHG